MRLIAGSPFDYTGVPEVRSDAFATVLPPIYLREGFTINFAGDPANLPLGTTARIFDNGR
jgi:hypothetical protein